MKIFIGNKTNQAIKICVDSIKDGIIFSGKVSAKESTSEMEFCDIQNLLLEIEDFLNDGFHPDAGKNLRHFNKEEHKFQKHMESIGKKKEGIEYVTCYEKDSRGKIATMILYVTQRSHATWQGRVYSMETGNVMNFKSELEFLKNFIDIIKTSIVTKDVWKTAL